MPLAFAFTTTTTPVNTFPTIAIISLFILLLYIASIFMSLKLLGVFAGLLTLLLGVWVAVAGIYYQTGYDTVGATTQLSVSVNNTTSTYQYVNVTKAYNFQKVQYPSIISNWAPVDAGQFLGLLTILLGIFACLYYGGRIYGAWI